MAEFILGVILILGFSIIMSTGLVILVVTALGGADNDIDEDIF